jgi:hypothetical protein
MFHCPIFFDSALLIRLTKKDQPFSWEIEDNIFFLCLKASFTTTPFLIHVHPSKPFVLEMDIFYFVIGVVLSQLGKDNLLHLVNFHSHNFSPVEINYDIHDKKKN